ncbi:uncharacterized protein CCOS01_15153 [Colletotrichum costaricense]|uniref:Uncharacterized protein n=2 Tax=Colletotrichum acutatum species complex TaxID=2707335 RepID=A0AAJ0DT98_9PEZI|nr:uncharacterized protein CCOS01_15153 [Colletotrichum costaricense]XP_060377677.1 uncharacterized protein CTAM01_11625 [Colletotrichum tamarilloi]KAK1487779.1 hypothetical protein CTAM01_11625 [Colletotrichum tamarilloi]KAK1510322.1 hypothetical protein CCOS01_15153 [Colletotrichum costaricense]
MPLYSVPLARAKMWLRRRRRQPWSPRTSLLDEARCSVIVLLGACFLTTILVTITLMRASSESKQPIAWMAELSIVLIITQTCYAAVFSIHKCILPPPGRISGLVYFYWLTWIGLQALSFFAVRHALHEDWSQTKYVALAWLFMSAGSVLIWTYVLVCLRGERHRRGRTLRHDTAGQLLVMQMETRERAIDMEAAVSTVQAPPSVVVREVKNEDLRLS